MPKPRRLPDDEPPSLLEARLVDRLCDQFDAAWRAGEHPAIETFLTNAPPAARDAALRELIAMDVEYRRRDGEAPLLDEYVTRFRESVPAVAVGFRRVACRREGNVPRATSSDAPDSAPTVVL